jgi:hypothetical protein
MHGGKLIWWEGWRTGGRELAGAPSLSAPRCNGEGFLAQNDVAAQGVLTIQSSVVHMVSVTACDGVLSSSSS